MNYLRTFYNQDKKFQADLSFSKRSSSYPVSFGLSGSGGSVLFNVSGDFVKINESLCSSLKEDGSTFFSLCGDSGNVTVWKGEFPIFHLYPSGFGFDRVFCNSIDDVDFSEKVYGEQPVISHSLDGFSGNSKSGHVLINNSGDYPLLINSISVREAPLSIPFSPTTINSKGSHSFPISLRCDSSFSGQAIFDLSTNAGSYEFSEDLSYDPVYDFKLISLFANNQTSFPSGSTDFLITNKGTQEALVNIFLDYVDGATPSSKEGFSTYLESGVETTFNHIYKGFYKSVLGQGGFIYNYDYSGLGTITGYVSGEVSGLVSGVVSGVTGMYPGVVSGDVPQYGPWVGPIRVDIEYTGLFSGSGGRLNATGVQIKTGTYPLYLPSGVSGENLFYIPADIDVYEGQQSIFESWDLEYNDLDNGLMSFKGLERVTSSGFGVSGINYRIPAGATTSGRINFLSQYDSKIFQSLILRVTDFSSINSFLYINT